MISEKNCVFVVSFYINGLMRKVGTEVRLLKLCVFKKRWFELKFFFDQNNVPQKVFHSTKPLADYSRLILVVNNFWTIQSFNCQEYQQCRSRKHIFDRKSSLLCVVSHSWVRVLSFLTLLTSLTYKSLEWIDEIRRVVELISSTFVQNTVRWSIV